MYGDPTCGMTLTLSPLRFTCYCAHAHACVYVHIIYIIQCIIHVKIITVFAVQRITRYRRGRTWVEGWRISERERERTSEKEIWHSIIHQGCRVIFRQVPTNPLQVCMRTRTRNGACAGPVQARYVYSRALRPVTQKPS